MIMLYLKPYYNEVRYYEVEVYVKDEEIFCFMFSGPYQ